MFFFLQNLQFIFVNLSICLKIGSFLLGVKYYQYNGEYTFTPFSTILSFCIFRVGSSLQRLTGDIRIKSSRKLRYNGLLTEPNQPILFLDQ